MRSLLPALAGLVFAVVAHAAVEVQDDRGRTVRLAQPPQRIVTLLPSLTESVCVLGACARIVGTDSFSDWPESVRRLPRVGGVDDMSIEAVVALRPDLVVLSDTARALPRLEALGVPVLGLRLKTLDDARRTLDKLAQVLGTHNAEATWQGLQRAIDAAAASVPAAARGVRVYFDIGSGYAASASSHIGEMLARLGAANVVPGDLGTVPQLNPEFVVRADPQLVIVGRPREAELRRRPGWQRIRALREGRVCVLDEAEEDVVMRPGPRLSEAAQVLARCLRGHAPEAAR